jgi:cytochrome c oxidase subunit II
MFLAASDITREVDRAFLLIGGVCLILLVGITVAMVMFAVKYRRSRARTTSQVSGNTALEIIWTIIPTMIVIWMFFVGYRGFDLMRRVPDDHMVVQVTGKQWIWSFYYPEEGVDASEMVVPVNEAVLVRLTAPPEDVIHSFFIPAFRTKEDALPGRETTMWFKPDREGVYSILCAEFCGKDHSQMTSWLKVVSRDEYDQWIREQQLKKFRPLEWDAIANPNSPGFEELKIDAPAIYGAMCASCHGEAGDGSGLPGEARSFVTLEDWKRTAKVTDIYRTLTEGIEGTRMRAFGNLTPWERVATAHHVRSFAEVPLPEDTREDYDVLVEEYGLDKTQVPQDTIPIERAMELLVTEAASADQPSEGRAAPDTP